MTTLTFDTVKVGDVVRVAEKHRTYLEEGDNHPLRLGAQYLVTEVVQDSHAGGGALVGLEGDYVRWGVSWFELAQRREAPARPTIDFSTDSRGKARQYAAEAQTPSLEEAHNVVLRQVEHRSTAVDAYALNAAVTAALSAAATRRLPNGLTRSELTSRIRHLGHIVQAVLENHADNLPAYAEGERSRKVKDLEAVLDKHQGRIRDLERDSDSLDAELNEALDQNRSLKQQIETERAAASDNLADVQNTLTEVLESAAAAREELERVTKALTERTQERDVYAAAYVYALEEAPPSVVLKLAGYVDGVADGITASATE